MPDLGALLVQADAHHLPLRDESVQTVVTSPPYWGLRQYAGEQSVEWGDGTTHPLGLEPTPELYVEHMVEVFREVKRVLRPDGTLWMNLGDSYAAGKAGRTDHGSSDSTVGLVGNSRGAVAPGVVVPRSAPPGYKPKDLVGIPWAVAFALRADGWYLRSDIIWHKPNPMPESVTDRPTKAHEYLFLLSKSERYFYDIDAIREPFTDSSIARISQPTFDQQSGGPKDYGPDSNRSQRKTLENFKKRAGANAFRGQRALRERGSGDLDEQSYHENGRNKRTVWTVATRPYSGAHFATYPEDLVEPCILAGSAVGDTVLDPFNGSGTTGVVAVRHNRNYVGVDISDEYLAEQAVRRLDGVQMEAAL